MASSSSSSYEERLRAYVRRHIAPRGAKVRFANHLGLPPSWVTRYESGSSIGLDLAFAIADYFKRPLGDIVGESPPEPVSAPPDAEHVAQTKDEQKLLALWRALADRPESQETLLLLASRMGKMRRAQGQSNSRAPNHLRTNGVVRKGHTPK